MKKIIYSFIIAGLLLFSFSAVLAGTANLNDAGANLGRAVVGTGIDTKKEITTTMSDIIKAVLALVGTVFFALTIYAGVLWMTAAGEEERVKKATSILQAAVIGLIIVMAAYAITIFITGRLGVK